MTATLFATLIAIIIGTVLVLRNRKRTYPTAPEPSKVTLPDIDKSIPDMPDNFGYKCMWYSIKTENIHRIAEILKLKSLEPCNWAVGVRKAYQGDIFITPTVGNWTMVAGRGLSIVDTQEDITHVKNILSQLSYEFGEAQYFCTHRIAEYHLWMRAIKGKITRAYSYLGESGGNVIVEGTPTEIEAGLNLINTFSEEANDKNYFSREDILIPDEQTVMDVAGNWSIDPSNLHERTDVKPGLGYLAKAD